MRNKQEHLSYSPKYAQGEHSAYFPATPTQPYRDADSDNEQQNPSKSYLLRPGSASGKAPVSLTSRLPIPWPPATTEAPSPSPAPLARHHSQQSSMITGLRSDLLNIRSEVSKLLVGKEPPRYEEREFSDTSSRSSSSRRGRESFPATTNTRGRLMELEVDSLREELSLMQRKYKDRKEHHKQETARLNRKVQLLQQMLEENEQRVEDYRLQISQEINCIQDQLDPKQAVAGYNGEDIAKIHEEIAVLEQELASARLEAEESRKRCAGLEQVVAKQREEAGREDYREMAARLEEANKRMREEIQTYTQEKVGLEEFRALEKAAADFKQSARASEEAYKKQVELLTQQAKESEQATESQISNLLKQLKQKDEQVVLLSTQHSQLTKTLKSSSCALAQTQAQLSHLQSNHSTTSTNFQSLSIQNSSLRTQLEELQDTNSKLQIELTQSREQLTQTAQQLQKAQSEVGNLDKHLAEAEEEINYLRKEMEEREAIIWKMEKEDVAVVDEFKGRLLALAQDQQALAQDLAEKCRLSEMQEHQIRNLGKLYKDTVEQLNSRSHDFEDGKIQYIGQIEQAQNEIKRLKQSIESKDVEYRQQVEELRQEVLSARGQTQRKEARMFDEALRAHIDENNGLRMQLRDKEEEIYKLKDFIVTHRSQIESIRAQTDIEKLKAIAERKNMQVTFDIQSQNLRNQLEVEKRTTDSLNLKVRYLIDEIKRKDDFIQKHIVSRKPSADEKFSLEEFFKSYSIEFPVSGIKDRINSELREIMSLEKNNRMLLAQVCALKESLKAQEQPTAATFAQQEPFREQVQDLDDTPPEIIQKEVNKYSEMGLTEETAELIGAESSIDQAADGDSVEYQ